MQRFEYANQTFNIDIDNVHLNNESDDLLKIIISKIFDLINDAQSSTDDEFKIALENFHLFLGPQPQHIESDHLERLNLQIKIEMRQSVLKATREAASIYILFLVNKEIFENCYIRLQNLENKNIENLYALDTINTCRAVQSKFFSLGFEEYQQWYENTGKSQIAYLRNYPFFAKKDFEVNKDKIILCDKSTFKAHLSNYIAKCFDINWGFILYQALTCSENIEHQSLSFVISYVDALITLLDKNYLSGFESILTQLESSIIEKVNCNKNKVELLDSARQKIKNIFSEQFEALQGMSSNKKMLKDFIMARWSSNIPLNKNDIHNLYDRISKIKNDKRRSQFTEVLEKFYLNPEMEKFLPAINNNDMQLDHTYYNSLNNSKYISPNVRDYELLLLHFAPISEAQSVFKQILLTFIKYFSVNQYSYFDKNNINTIRQQIIFLIHCLYIAKHTLFDQGTLFSNPNYGVNLILDINKSNQNELFKKLNQSLQTFSNNMQCKQYVCLSKTIVVKFDNKINDKIKHNENLTGNDYLQLYAKSLKPFLSGKLSKSSYDALESVFKPAQYLVKAALLGDVDARAILSVKFKINNLLPNVLLDVYEKVSKEILSLYCHGDANYNDAQIQLAVNYYARRYEKIYINYSDRLKDLYLTIKHLNNIDHSQDASIELFKHNLNMDENLTDESILQCAYSVLLSELSGYDALKNVFNDSNKNQQISNYPFVLSEESLREFLNQIIVEDKFKRDLINGLVREVKDYTEQEIIILPTLKVGNTYRLTLDADQFNKRDTDTISFVDAESNLEIARLTKSAEHIHLDGLQNNIELVVAYDLNICNLTANNINQLKINVDVCSKDNFQFNSNAQVVEYLGKINSEKSIKFEVGSKINISKDSAFNCKDEFNLKAIAGTMPSNVIKAKKCNLLFNNTSTMYTEQLYNSILNKDTQLMQSCLNAGISLVSDSTIDWTIKRALTLNHLSMVKYVIESGVNINQVYNNGKTLLQYACEQGRYEIARLLLRNGANIKDKTKNGETLLQLAQKSGNQMLIEYLMNFKKSPPKDFMPTKENYVLIRLWKPTKSDGEVIGYTGCIIRQRIGLMARIGHISLYLHFGNNEEYMSHWPDATTNIKQNNAVNSKNNTLNEDIADVGEGVKPHKHIILYTLDFHNMIKKLKEIKGKKWVLIRDSNSEDAYSCSDAVYAILEAGGLFNSLLSEEVKVNSYTRPITVAALAEKASKVENVVYPETGSFLKEILEYVIFENAKKGTTLYCKFKINIPDYLDLYQNLFSKNCKLFDQKIIELQNEADRTIRKENSDRFLDLVKKLDGSKPDNAEVLKSIDQLLTAEIPLDLTSKDKDGYNALHCAILNGSEYCVQKILQKFTDAICSNVIRDREETRYSNHRLFGTNYNNDKITLTPLDLAKEKGNTAMIDLLIRNGATSSSIHDHVLSSMRCASTL